MNWARLFITFTLCFMVILNLKTLKIEAYDDAELYEVPQLEDNDFSPIVLLPAIHHSSEGLELLEISFQSQLLIFNKLSPAIWKRHDVQGLLHTNLPPPYWT